MTAPQVDLTLVLACYNEEEIFRSSVDRILQTLDAIRVSYEVIFVEDKSRDATANLIREAIAARPGKPLRAIFHDRNQGRGATVSDGFREAKGRVMGFIDIDLEVGPEYILPCYLAAGQGADVVIGLRIYRLYWHSLLRHVLSRGYHKLVSVALGMPPLDTESGYKFFRREAALELLSKTKDPGWFWDTEIVARAVEAGCRIVEVPCLFQRRWDKTSTVRPLRDSIVYLRRLLKYKKAERGG
ncbi:MAG: glycosyltransferase [Elusimicrobia bacterium]|nr:glycosyltransferase [Elusimicrobiota bacterium]